MDLDNQKVTTIEKGEGETRKDKIRKEKIR